MTTMTSAVGRPRDTNVDAAVLDATATLLALHGYAGLRINDVVAKTGVAKTTIYRRWPTLVHLAVATMEHLLGERTVPPGTDPRAALEDLVSVGLTSLASAGTSVLPIALDIHAQNDPDLAARYRERIIDPLRDALITTIAQGQEEGSMRAGLPPENLADAIIGGLMYRSAVLHQPITTAQALAFARGVTA